MTFHVKPFEILEKCPVCGGGKFNPFLECVDFTVSKEKFQLVSCLSCSFVLTNPRPGKNSIGAYYESEDYISHSDTSKGLINKAYRFIQNINLGLKYRWVKYIAPSAQTLLDIGCGTGYFASYCKSKGMEVSGYEPSEKAAKLAREKGINLLSETDLNSKHASFDVITMWHVLEHVHDLNKEVNRLNKLLQKDGTAVIAVPNLQSWDAKHYREHWAAYDVPRHLYHFSAPVLKKLFSKHDFAFEKSFPMKFDAFYVSILSQKYQGCKTSLIHGLMRGLRSNLSAGDPEEYSSTVYIFRRQ